MGKENTVTQLLESGGAIGIGARLKARSDHERFAAECTWDVHRKSALGEKVVLSLQISNFKTLRLVRSWFNDRNFRSP